MEHLGIEVRVKNPPALDPGFLPIGLWNREFLKTAAEQIMENKSKLNISTLADVFLTVFEYQAL